ncbi:unnamed protein product [Prunus armeniaca]|nr:hypothetical protein GBA52_008133 [Prunus armeniaca]
MDMRRKVEQASGASLKKILGIAGVRAPSEAQENPCRKRWSCRVSLLKGVGVVNEHVTLAWILPRWRLLV